MNKLKSAVLLVPAVSLGLFTGCGQDSSTAKASDAFFEAFNHLCEQDSLQASGQLNLQGNSANYTLAFSSDPQQLAATLFFTDNETVGFYIKDGRTYLDYFGTKSSSLASNLGISDDDPFEIPNPFLELSKQERADLFSSVSVDENTYTFTFKNSEIEKFLDSYGAVSVDKAVMQATIENSELTWMSLDIDGTFDIGTQSTALDLQGNCIIESAGKAVTVTFPADMSPDTWNATATPEEQELFNQALQAVGNDSQEK